MRYVKPLLFVWNALCSYSLIKLTQRRIFCIKQPKAMMLSYGIYHYYIIFKMNSCRQTYWRSCIYNESTHFISFEYLGINLPLGVLRKAALCTRYFINTWERERQIERELDRETERERGREGKGRNGKEGEWMQCFKFSKMLEAITAAALVRFRWIRGSTVFWMRAESAAEYQIGLNTVFCSRWFRRWMKRPRDSLLPYFLCLGLTPAITSTNDYFNNAQTFCLIPSVSLHVSASHVEPRRWNVCHCAHTQGLPHLQSGK